MHRNIIKLESAPRRKKCLDTMFETMLDTSTHVQNIS